MKLETASSIRKIGLHQEVLMQKVDNLRRRFESFTDDDKFIYSCREEALIGEGRSPEWQKLINRYQEFYLADGRLLIQEGHFWTSQSRNDPSPIAHFDWIAYFSQSRDRLLYWQAFCISHLEAREELVLSWERVNPGVRNLQNVWL